MNANYKFRAVMAEEKDPLEIGDHVRVMLLNRKEQVDTKTKGFAAHWSTDTYVVMDRKRIARNRGRFKYILRSDTTLEGLDGGRFRHELLRIKVKLDEIDRNVPNVPIQNVPEQKYWVEGSGADDW